MLMAYVVFGWTCDWGGLDAKGFELINWVSESSSSTSRTVAFFRDRERSERSERRFCIRCSALCE